MEVFKTIANITANDISAAKVSEAFHQATFYSGLLWFISNLIAVADRALIMADISLIQCFKVYSTIFLEKFDDIMLFCMKMNPLLFGHDESEDTVEEEPEIGSTQDDDSSDEAIAEDYSVGEEWDLGSADDTDEYLTDLEEEDEMIVDQVIAKLMTGAMRSYAQSSNKQSIIANTIHADEFLLDEGLINPSQFGETIMTDI